MNFGAELPISNAILAAVYCIIPIRKVLLATAAKSEFDPRSSPFYFIYEVSPSLALYA